MYHEKKNTQGPYRSKEQDAWRQRLREISDPEYLARDFVETHYLRERAGSVAEGDYTLHFWRGDFFRWREGAYERISKEDVTVQVVQHMQNLNFRARQLGEPVISITSGRVRDVLVHVRSIYGVHVMDYVEPNTYLSGVTQRIVNDDALIVTNGILHMQKMREGEAPQLADHTPDFFAMVKLPYEYRPDAECPQWKAFLADILEGDGDRVALLQQWAGYILTPGMKQHKFLLIAGDGSNGKTVFTTMLERMVGLDNVSHIPLAQFGRRFSLSATLGKLLNSTSESAYELTETAETTLKAWTSGDRQMFERKFRDPVSAVPTAKIMISTNQLPAFGDKSSGLWRRMLYVPFERTYTEKQQDRDLIDKLTAELPGILNWAIEGRRTLQQRGRFIEPLRCRQARKEYQLDRNPARTFLTEHYIADAPDNEGIACQTLYDAYRTFCETGGYRPANQSTFGREVKRTFPIVERRQMRPQRKYIYSGLRKIGAIDTPEILF